MFPSRTCSRSPVLDLNGIPGSELLSIGKRADHSLMRIPRPIVAVHGEDVDVEVPGVVTIRATFLSEGLFDERAGGDPEEEDLYEVEVTHPGEALLQPLTFPRLMPSTSALADDEDEPVRHVPIERFAMVLAWDLAQAHPSNWSRVCEAARGWDSWMLEDAFSRLPPDWTPELLLPDED